MRDRLVEKLKKHDEKALSKIIEQQSGFVASVIYNTSKGSLTKEDIEEVIADVFVTLWNNAEKVQEGKLKGYLCSIAKTRALNKIKSLKNKAVLNIDSKSEPNVVRDYTRNAKIKISPLSISLSGECDREYDKSMEDREDRCFISADTDGKSKVIMDDGTVYYVLVNEGGGRRTDDNGVFCETTYLQYSATEEPAIDLASNRIIIDIDKIQSVIINGDTIYQK